MQSHLAFIGSVLPCSVTDTLVDVPTTCAFVMTWPLSSHTKPVPTPLGICALRGRYADGANWLRGSGPEHSIHPVSERGIMEHGWLPL